MPQDKVKLKVGDNTNVSPRRITPEDLVAIEEEVSQFSTLVVWMIKDELGEHSGDDLSAVLRDAIWDSVKAFRCAARISGGGGTAFVSIDSDITSNRLTFMMWSSEGGFKREAAERAYKKVILLLKNLPAAPETNIYTTRDAEEGLRAAEQQRLDKEEALLAATRIQTTKEPDPWWRRARRAAPARLIAFVTAIGASLVAGGILLLIFA